MKISFTTLMCQDQTVSLKLIHVISWIIQHMWMVDIVIYIYKYYVLLCNIFRPPGTFWHRLSVAIENALDASKRIIIVGNLNADQLNVLNYHVKDILTINYLVNTLEVPTRDRTTPAPRPDNRPCFRKKILDSGVIEISLAVSDHYATYILVDFQL